MFVVSFYSYKGGVGRSVALMNTAQQLAASGRKIAMLDFDLEAPGLHSACNAVWPGVLKNSQLGFTDFFAKYVNHRAHPPAIDDYVSAGFGPNKLIRLVPAGDLSDFNQYSKKLLQVNDGLLAPDNSARELLLKVRDDLAEMGFDYLLVDSRTGHTDILGATTVLLPHLVVFITNLSTQSLIGTRSVLNWVRSASDAAIKKVRPPEETMSNRFFLRSTYDPAIQMLLVASPVPLGDHSAVATAESLKGLGRAFDHLIYYVPQIAAHETQHVAKTNREDPVQQYKTLADKIRALNPFEPSTLVQYGMESLERQDWTRALSYFDAAEHFLAGKETGESDEHLRLRRQYGEVRALALGFQTGKARELLDSLEEGAVPEGLEGESLAANLQMVRGHLASNELTQALGPATNAVNRARKLGELRGRTDAWEVLARLQLGDVYCFLGKMSEAENEVRDVPKQAEVLNRAMERVKAYQLLATAQASAAKFDAAQTSLNASIEQAEGLGVGYLIAGCAFVQSVIDLTCGKLSPENADKLDAASKTYANEGDGLSAADCLTELAMYRHRLGSKDESQCIDGLQNAWKLYTEIAGTALGQISVLLYVAEIQSDRGTLYTGSESADPGFNRFQSAGTALIDALKIIDHYKLREDLRQDIEAWGDLLSLFVKNRDLQTWLKGERGSRSVSSESPELFPRVVVCERNRAFKRLLTKSNAKDLDRLEWIAQEAERQQLGYNEAVARTLVALGKTYFNDQKHVDVQLERIRDLVQQGNLGWSIWGYVHNVSRHLDVGTSSQKWRPAASSLLEIAETKGMTTKIAARA
jgi:MinD-like ATPase involved in chromosome partitioning or flagellar assembly